ncbi:MAG: hypothetical protein ACQEWG_16750 [Bacteroidota bacterium]
MNFLRSRLICFIVVFQTLAGCAPKLTFTEIEKRVNLDYTAFNENDIEYEFQNTPVKYLKEYGEEGFREKLQKIYDLRKTSKYPIFFDRIGDLRIQDIDKCNSTYFYKVKYVVDKVQMTPYIDSTALERNYKSYGRNNVRFNPNSEILEIRLTKKSILVFDRDKEWKLLDYEDFDEQLYNRLFGTGFSDCLTAKVKESDYLPYW